MLVKTTTCVNKSKCHNTSTI